MRLRHSLDECRNPKDHEPFKKLGIPDGRQGRKKIRRGYRERACAHIDVAAAIERRAPALRRPAREAANPGGLAVRGGGAARRKLARKASRRQGRRRSAPGRASDALCGAGRQSRPHSRKVGLQDGRGFSLSCWNTMRSSSASFQRPRSKRWPSSPTTSRSRVRKSRRSGASAHPRARSTSSSKSAGLVCAGADARRAGRSHTEPPRPSSIISASI